MRLDIVTVFPAYLDPLHLSLVGKAIEGGLVDLHVHDLREYTHDRHRTVDDTPYGGGPGMVMRPEPWGEVLDAVLAGDGAGPDGVGTDGVGTDGVVVVPTPSGTPFTQATAQRWAGEAHLTFACGRYEGIDSRVVAHYRDRVRVEEVSVGDYVLAGGEAAVLVMVEAVVRLLPGVLGNAQSAQDDSFAAGEMAALLEGPVYTKPPQWRGLDVPEVLLSGNHGAIATWRREQARLRTRETRPDLAP